MPLLALTVTILVALLRSLQGRRTPRRRRILRKRHGIFFRGAFRRTFFHPRRHGRRPRNGFIGRRGRHSFSGRRGRRFPNRRSGRRGHGGQRQNLGVNHGWDSGILRRPDGDPGAGPSRP